MSKEQKTSVKPKLMFILLVFLCMLVGLLGLIFYLKTVKGEEYENRAKNQQINRYDAIAPANRGAVVDRNNQALAVSTAIYNVVLDPRNLFEAEEKDQEKTLAALVAAFPNEIEYDTVKHYITKDPKTEKPYLDTNWKYLVKGIDRVTKEDLEKKDLKGLVFEQDTKRTYPLRGLACHVLGFTRGDTSWGIESYYNKYLSGTPGRSFITYDGGTTALRQDYEAQDGDTVVTTIDYTIQQYAEEIVKETNTEWPSDSVSAIVMNPNTGEILAMADSNTFDLNEPSIPQAFSSAEQKPVWDAMDPKTQMEHLNKTWKNYCVSSTFEPGSIFKPVVIAAALEENVITVNDTFFCSGSVIIADRLIRCHLRSGHGTQTIEDVMANSCNMGMIQIAEKMGKDMFYKYQRDFGFGERTGIDVPGEVSAESLMYTPDRIGPTELATMAFGQSFNATAIQSLSAFAATINGGELIRPYVVSRILNSKGDLVLENKKKVVRKVISTETSDIVRKYLKSTVERGTGKKARIEGYSIGGKTGTGEQGKRGTDRWVMSYVAYFPVENPEYIVMTIIDKPDKYIDGVQTPAPMTKKLMENIIKYKNIQPSYEVVGSDSKKANGVAAIEDYKDSDLQGVIAMLDAKGLKYKIVGTGNIVTNQAPRAGTKMQEGSEVILYVKKEEGDTGSISVPDVTGLTHPEAVTKLNDAGFSVVTNGDETGVVVSQNPKHGVFLEDGSEITIKLE